MTPRIEELDWQQTPMGVISLRKRFDTVLDAFVYEVKLDDEYLMSSAFTASEEALSTLALAELDGIGWDVLVGGLGLGYTAGAALADDRVTSVTVVEAAEHVVDWHRRELLPTSPRLTADSRARLVHADFFAAIAGRVVVAGVSDESFDAVLVDIDHTPQHLLHESHSPFYSVDGLAQVRERLRDGGVLGVWSDDPADEVFLAALRQVYVDVAAHVVSFPNPYTHGESACTVYLARRRPD